MSDEYILQKSLASDKLAQPFINKEVLYISDSNNGAYNGQIQLDTSVLSNSGKWLDYSAGTLEIPFIMTMKSDTDITGATLTSGWLMGLKNGHHQLVDSIQVDYNNTNVVQLQPFTNAYVSYKMMTGWSQDQLTKWGAQCGFQPDTAGASMFSAGASANGNGSSNNVPLDPIIQYVYTGARPQVQSNEGFRKRLEVTSCPAAGYGGNPALVTSAAHNTLAKSYFDNDAGAGSARIFRWHVLASIRLCDLCDFFKQMPLVRGAFLRLTINYNSCTQTVTSVAVGPTLVQAAPTMTAGRTNPMLMASSAVGAPMNLLVAGGGGAVLSLACGISSVASPAGTNALLSSCRLYIPAYEMSPVAESEYLSMKRVKEISYTDIYQYTVSNVAAGASFNQILTNGIIGAEELVVIPVFNGTAGVAATIALQTYQSCFDTVPATSSPLAALTQFNVQLSGKNVFQQNLQYDSSVFRDEVVSANTSDDNFAGKAGLIGRQDWDALYRYYVVDLSRRLASEDAIPKSVTITGTNAGAKAVDLLCFISFRRSIQIDLSTGNLLL